MNDIKDFTRVFLMRDPSVRSVDGTFTVIYVDKAVCTNEDGCGDVPAGQPIKSDKWLITVPGGGGCAQDDCLTDYADPAERGEMTTATDTPMKRLFGIHDPDESDNPVFAGYNRVRVEKSSYDRYMGRASWQSEDGVVVHSHGFLIMQEALETLRNGLHYDTWVEAGGPVVEEREKLPALAKAEQVVFVGHSGGSHGLLHNVDHLAAMLEGWGGFDGDVRAILDENFVPGIENESLFNGAPGGDAYSDQWIGASTVSNGTFSYNGEQYLTPGLATTAHVVTQYQAWQSEMDASCLAAHANAGAWKCHDRQHVLLNHIETPFLVKEDFTDLNAEHNNGSVGHLVLWGDPVVNLTRDEFRMRVMSQAASLIELSSTRSELGLAFPTSYVWINDCQSHTGVYEDDIYYRTRIEHEGTAYSLREWVEQFVAAPRHGASDFRVVGYPETEMAADCDE